MKITHIKVASFHKRIDFILLETFQFFMLEKGGLTILRTQVCIKMTHSKTKSILSLKNRACVLAAELGKCNFLRATASLVMSVYLKYSVPPMESAPPPGTRIKGGADGVTVLFRTVSYNQFLMTR